MKRVRVFFGIIISLYYLFVFCIYRYKVFFGFEVIWRNDKVVGFIWRGEYGYVIGKSMVYGYVKDFSGKLVIIEFLKLGKYSIESMGELFFV